MQKIMFNDRYGLTEAVLNGRKTQTRRIERMRETINLFNGEGYVVFGEEKGMFVKPRYKVGEIVAVAQSYKDAGVRFLPCEDEEFGCHDFPAKQTNGWTNKMFVRADLMPHRIRITNIRIERLQDISDDDCMNEGIMMSMTDNFIGFHFNVPFNHFVGEDKKGCRYATPRDAYAALIDRVSGKGTWERNPYVVVYDYELVK